MTTETTSPNVQTEPKRKTFRLFKRDDAGRDLPPEAPGWKDRPYNFRFSFRGKSYTRSLETNDSAMAQKLARAKFKEIRESVMRGDLGRLEKTKLRVTPLATVHDILTAYETAPVEASAHTRRQNSLALRQLLRVSLGIIQADGPPRPVAKDGPELALDVSHINAQLARRWFEHATTRVTQLNGQGAAASFKRSANSRFVQARSVFAPKALQTYKDKGFYHPTFEEFSGAGESAKFARVARLEYTPPVDDIIQRTLVAWQAIGGNSIPERNLFLAVGHELAFGLRIGELAQGTWTWWSQREGYPVLDGAAVVKSQTGLIQVRALDPWFSIMRERVLVRGWNKTPAEFILAGTMTDRVDCIPRTVSEWMRSLGWETHKTNHELRKYAGSQVAMKYGIYDAQCWLRHSTVKITEQHYSSYIKRFKPANLDSIPARWCTTSTNAPQLRLLEA